MLPTPKLIPFWFLPVWSSASGGGDEEAAAEEGKATEIDAIENEKEQAEAEAEGDESLLGKRKTAPRADDEEIDIDEDWRPEARVACIVLHLAKERKGERRILVAEASPLDPGP
jgi:hypothetical protein